MADTKLIPLSRVRPANKASMDTVAREKRQRNDRSRALDVIMEAQIYWTNMERFRRDRERNKRYTYGDQWKDTVSVDGRVCPRKPIFVSREMCH